MLSVGRRITLASLLLRLYPSAWRQRYEQEMLALLEEHTISFLTLLDLLFGALDAQLHSKDKKGRLFFMFRNLRTTATTFACAFIMYALAQISLNMLPFFAGMHGSFRGVVLPLFNISTTGSLVLSLILLTSNLMIAIPLLRGQLAERKKGRVLFSIACLVAIFLWSFLQAFNILSAHFTNIFSTLSFYVLYAFELLPSVSLWSGVFIITSIAKELLASQRKKLFSFAIGSYIIIPFFLSYLLSELTISYFVGANPISRLFLGFHLQTGMTNINSLLPYFLGVGALALTISRKETRRRTAFVPLIAATALTLAMVVQMATRLLMFLLIIPGGTITQTASSTPFPFISFLSFNALYMFLAAVLACVAIVRWWALLLTTQPQPKESEGVAQVSLQSSGIN